MSENQVKQRIKKNSKLKYEVSKPNFLIPSKIDKFLQKKPKKINHNIDDQNQKKIANLKKKINKLQEILTKNKLPIASKKAKNSLSKEKLKKYNNNDKKNNISTDKDISNINQRINQYNIKSPYQANSNNYYKKHILFNSFHSRFNSEQEQLLNDSHNYIALRYSKDYFNKIQKETNNNQNKKIEIEDYYIKDLTHRDKMSKLRNNDNYSIDKENSIDKSINFNQLKNNIREYKNNKDKDEKKNIRKNTKNTKSGDIKLSNINLDNLNNDSISYSKIKQDKSIPQTLKILDDEMNIIPTTNKSNFSSKKDLIHDNHLPNSDQTEVRHLENISKETPSTKNTIKTETKITDHIYNYKNNNKITSADLSIKNSERKKKHINKSVNRINTTNRQKLISNSSKKHIMEHKNNPKNNHSHENRNKYNNNLSKIRNIKTNNRIVNGYKLGKKMSNISNFLELTTSPFVRNRHNITSLPSNKNITKNIISLRKAPINYKLNFNSSMGYFNTKKEYDSAMDINKKLKKNKKKKKKHTSFNLSQSIMNKIQENYKNNNIMRNNNSTIKNKTEKNSKTSTYKNNNKISEFINLNNIHKKSLEVKEEKEREKEKEK